MDGAARGDGGDEVEANAIYLEHDGDRRARCAAGALHDWIGIFAAREKAGQFSVLRQDVRFREDLNDPLGFEGLQGPAQIQPGEECEQIKVVGQTDCAAGPD